MNFKTPSSMSEELGAWSGGSGIDLESWVACSGNFRFAVGYATVFWPEFIVHREYVFRQQNELSFEDREFQVSSFEKQPNATRQSVEAVINHLHLRDIQHRFCEDISVDKLILLGKVLTEIYNAKLAWQFPKRSFAVDLHIPVDPEDLDAYQITFWQTEV